jgi:2-polyprenyl-3-methyl-5-hydroxy-6-metoxy-1,4-benzoquinol methylase
MFQVKLHPNDNKRLHRTLNGTELTRSITLDDCWKAYQSERKQAWTVNNLQERHKSSQYKLDLIPPQMGSILDTLQGGTLLDVGCGDGIIGYEFAHKYKLTPSYTDVVNTVVLKDVDFVVFDPDAPLPQQAQYNIISCFHILHHIPTLFGLQFRLKDIRSRLQGGGYLIIKEHDVQDQTMNKKIAWQHICYEIKEINEGMTKDELNKWITNYKLLLYSQQTLRRIIEECGYVYVNSSKPTAFDGSYYALFKRA